MLRAELVFDRRKAIERAHDGERERGLRLAQHNLAREDPLDQPARLDQQQPAHQPLQLVDERCAQQRAREQLAHEVVARAVDVDVLAEQSLGDGRAQVEAARPCRRQPVPRAWRDERPHRREALQRVGAQRGARAALPNHAKALGEPGLAGGVEAWPKGKGSLKVGQAERQLRQRGRHPLEQARLELKAGRGQPLERTSERVLAIAREHDEQPARDPTK